MNDIGTRDEDERGEQAVGWLYVLVNLVTMVCIQLSLGVVFQLALPWLLIIAMLFWRKLFKLPFQKAITAKKILFQGLLMNAATN